MFKTHFIFACVVVQAAKRTSYSKLSSRESGSFVTVDNVRDLCKKSSFKLSLLLMKIQVIETAVKEVQKNLDQQKDRLTGNVCPKSWIFYADHCYYISENEMDWSSARRKCRDEGGYLAEVNNEAENTFLRKEAMYTRGDLWLGGSDIGQEGDWVWVTSQEKISADSYTDWYPGQPSNHGGKEHCLHLFHTWKYHWNDVECEAKYRYVCERNM